MLKHGISLFLTLLTKLVAFDYFLSFYFIVKNSAIVDLKLNCSKALTYKYIPKKYLFSISFDGKSVNELCKTKQDLIFSHLFKRKLYIFSNDTLLNKSLKSRIKLSYPPKRFDIIIKNGEAKFYLKE